MFMPSSAFRVSQQHKAQQNAAGTMSQPRLQFKVILVMPAINAGN